MTEKTAVTKRWNMDTFLRKCGKKLYFNKMNALFNKNLSLAVKSVCFKGFF